MKHVLAVLLLLAISAWVWLHSYSACAHVYAQCELNLDKISYSTFVKDENGQLLHVLLAKDERYRIQTQVQDVDPNYLKLLLNYEDKRFYQHNGIDWRGVIRAIYQNVMAGKVVSGASTLSMQTVSLLNPQAPSLRNKINEIRKAIYLEKHLTKKQILGIYLSIAPFGGNIESVQMASLYWFGKSSKRLTPSQAALLVSLPQSPETRRPDRYIDAAIQGRNKVLNRALVNDLIAAEYLASALLSPINPHPFEIPKNAPHLAWRCYYQQQDCSKTTLNEQIQSQVNSLIKQYSLASNANLAVLVADANTGAIKAYHGSQNYYDFAQLGANDYIQAKRSPGSTLKPFIYAMAVDEGNLSFSDMVNDRLSNFAGYQPLNISKKFLGDITVAQALKASLNIPAVATLKGIGSENFLSRLQVANINMTNADGLSLALGGGGLTLWELSKLYTLLSNDGEVVDLHFTDKQTHNIKLFEATTIAQLNTILSQYIRGLNRVSGNITSVDIALKTGTGPNQSDAWSIGNNGNYVVGVWVGSPSGGGLVNNFGAVKALPLLTQIFDTLAQGTLKKAPLPDFNRPTLQTELSALQIVYPEHDSRIEVKQASLKIRPQLIAARYPINILINDKTHIVLAQPSDYLNLSQSGAYSLLFIDSRGQSASVYFYIKLDES